MFCYPAECGVTNRRLLDRKALLDFKKPFDLIPEYKKSYEKENFAQERSLDLSCPLKNTQSNIWSQLLNAARTYFETLMTKV